MTEAALAITPRRRHWSDWVGVVAYTLMALNLLIRSKELGILMLPSLLHELLVAAAFLTRGPARRASVGWIPRAVGYAHTFLFIVFIQAAAIWHPQWVTASDHQTAKLAGSYLWLVSSVIALWPLWYLRRSFSLEPEARHLVIAGPYRLARHPIYAVYVLTYFGIWLRTLNPVFLAVYLLWFVLLFFRIRYEEGVLSAEFPEYADYRRRVGALGPKLARAGA
jgi:protein-S-isoprenylcysteine O-methyltransferase Ste14